MAFRMSWDPNPSSMSFAISSRAAQAPAAMTPVVLPRHILFGMSLEGTNFVRSSLSSRGLTSRGEDFLEVRSPLSTLSLESSRGGSLSESSALRRLRRDLLCLSDLSLLGLLRERPPEGAETPATLFPPGGTTPECSLGVLPKGPPTPALGSSFLLAQSGTDITPPAEKLKGVSWFLGGLDPKWHDATPEWTFT